MAGLARPICGFIRPLSRILRRLFSGDYAMLKNFPKLQMGIIFNLLRDPSKGIGLLQTKAIETYGQEDALYYLQGRDENKGVLLNGRETIKLDSKEAQLSR